MRLIVINNMEELLEDDTVEADVVFYKNKDKYDVVATNDEKLEERSFKEKDFFSMVRALLSI